MSGGPWARPRAALRCLGSRWSARRASDAGYAAIMVALIVPVVGLGCAAVAVDTANWYVEVAMVQKAADAASLGGVPFLPQDLPSARARALEIAKRNGYDNNGSTNKVTVGLGERPTQLLVTISSTIDNQFGSMIGVNKATIIRSSVADFQGPAPMGSPCNTFGNEPDAGNGSGSAKPTGSAQGSSPYANCKREPQLWANIEAPDTGKVQGDRYQTRKCEDSGVDGCTGGKDNDEYDEFGYVFLVKVAQAAVGTQVDLQLFDPMFVNTGQSCNLLPAASSYPASTGGHWEYVYGYFYGYRYVISKTWVADPDPDVNDYVGQSDARDRYTKDGTNKDAYCTGDSYPGSGSGSSPKRAMTTSFVLREQTDTQNPTVAGVQKGTNGQPCISQYGSYNRTNASISTDVFEKGKGSYDDEVARQFHNWVSYCKFTPQRAGDYYLQVRSNVKMGGAGGTYIKTGNTAAADKEGNEDTGDGSNAFAVRAVTASGREKDVSVSGYNHMPIYINADTATAEFNLIRILPGAAGQKISFSYFDAGDAASAGNVQVLPPTDATGSITGTPFPGGCTAYGGSAGGSPTSQAALSSCTAPFEKSGGTSKNNGKTETITIPIPGDYTCNYSSFGGCWYRVRVAFGAGDVHDVTTWDATVIGDPVRIVK